MKENLFYFKHPVGESEFDLQKMNEIRNVVSGFVHDSRLIDFYGVNSNFGLMDAYQFAAPIIWSRPYLDWLKCQVASKGGEFVEKQITRRLTPNQVKELCNQFNADTMINCTGLGAKELGDDSMYPLRGALIQLRWKNGRANQFSAHCITNDETGQQNMIYLVPREDYLLLGGIAEPNQWDISEQFLQSEIVQNIKNRCFEFMPQLGDFVETNTNRRYAACDRRGNKMFAWNEIPESQISFTIAGMAVQAFHFLGAAPKTSLTFSKTMLLSGLRSSRVDSQNKLPGRKSVQSLSMLLECHRFSTALRSRQKMDSS